MKVTLQKLVLPMDEKLKQHWGLFYRGPCCAEEETEEKLYIPAYQTLDFATYLNGLPLNKWKRYTNLKNLSFSLTARGHFRLNLVGYSLNPAFPDRHEYAQEKFNLENKETVQMDFPDVAEEFVSFEIVPYSCCEIYSGCFTGEYEDQDVHTVNLSIATTTCHKEKFIKQNVSLIRRSLLEPSDDIKEHLFVHVVDNGNTLTPEEIDSYHITLHPNKNTGGSGGYARGMIEALHQNPPATHVLLMDDDVLVLPESIRRTYTLLKVIKPEYEQAFISGAMLEYDAMFMQHEDIGTMKRNGDWCPAKPTFDENQLINVLHTNRELSYLENTYSAWWYCCIPVKLINKNGLPLPLFIRADDMEYGMRCHPEILTMTGMCIWHMGFTNKYNASMDFYQSFRNALIAQATSNILQDVDIIGRIKREFRREILEFCYDSAELILMALEDFMKGPDFIAQVDGENLMLQNRKLNEVMKSLSNFEGVEVRLNEVYDNPPRKFLEKWIYRFTYNGQRFWPKKWLKKEPAVIGFDWSYQPQKQSLRSQLLAVNIFDKTGNLRVQNRKRYRKLQSRYHKDMRLYKRQRVKLERDYSAAQRYLTSEEFWSKYLNLVDLEENCDASNKR